MGQESSKAIRVFDGGVWVISATTTDHGLTQAKACDWSLYTRWIGSDGCSVTVSVEFMITYLWFEFSETIRP